MCLYRCDVPITDRDGDRIENDFGKCPDDPQNDADGDGFCANEDNCPDVPNPGQEDSDNDGRSDACDVKDGIGTI